MNINNAVEALLKKNVKVYFAGTGAGIGVVDLILPTPGVSSILVGSCFTYEPKETNSFLETTDWKYGYCSIETAVAFAQKAFYRCEKALSKENTSPIIGIGFTGVLPTNRILKGGARFFLAVQTSAGIYTCSVKIDQLLVSRKTAIDFCNLAVLNLLLCAVNLKQITMDMDGLTVELEDFICVNGGFVFDPTFYQLTSDLILPKPVIIYPNGKITSIEKINFSNMIIAAGSFNPLHWGHESMAKTTEKETGKTIIFEISRSNVDKGNIPATELQKRVHQFFWKNPVIVSDIARYSEKIDAYKGASFVVGFDTAVRILSPAYYGGRKGLRLFLEKCKATGTIFYVFERNGKNCKNLPIPWGFKRQKIFVHLPGSWNISSTEIRNGGEKNE